MEQRRWITRQVKGDIDRPHPQISRQSKIKSIIPKESKQKGKIGKVLGQNKHKYETKKKKSTLTLNTLSKNPTQNLDEVIKLTSMPSD